MATDPKAIAFASDVQGEAFGYGPHPMCMSGGWGSGKTWLGCMKGLFLSTTYPKNRGVICRHVGKELRETTMATFYKICPPHLYSRRGGGRRNDQQGYVRLITGSEILFLHLDDPQTEGVIRGLEANWMLIDQAEENADHMEELFDLLFGRMGRWDVAEVPDALIEGYAAAGKQWPYMHPETGKPTPPSYVMLACNPDVETHWIYRRFHPDSLEWQRKYKAQGYRMFHMPSTDNKFLPKENLEKLLAQDESFQRRNVRGEWGNPEGTIHAVSPLSEIDGTPELVEYLLQTCTLFRSMDYGDSAPTCVLWWAVDRNGNVVCYREYYVPNLIISAHRTNVAALSKDEFYEMNLADPSIFHKMPTKQGGRWCVADEWAECTTEPRKTAVWWSAADNNELGTRNRINEYLRVDQDRLNPFTRTAGSPRLFFVKATDAYPEGCVQSLRQLRAQRRLKIGTDLGKPIFSDERDPTIVDHGYDPTRYFLASRPPAPADPRILIPGTFQRIQEQAKAFRKQMTVR